MGWISPSSGHRIASRLLAPVSAAMLLATPAVAGMPTCTADCNANSVVAVNELILCVLAALGLEPIDNCPACDPNGDARVTIHELIAGVAYSTGQAVCPHGDPFSTCGDTVVQGREECDDGNTVGGDDCAANCTFESARRGQFDSSLSQLTWPGRGVAVAAAVSGALTLRTGRAVDLLDATSPFESGDVPAAIRAAEFNVDPVAVDGLACLCLDAVPGDSSAGVAASGILHCGETFQVPIDYRVEADGQVVWSARPVPKGSGVIEAALSITLLNHAGACSQRGPNPDDSCTFSDYGPDCLPCTTDDVTAHPVVVALTTGTVTVAHGDAVCLDPPCEEGQETGAPFDCDLIDSTQSEGLSGAALAFASASDDGPLLGILTFE